MKKNILSDIVEVLYDEPLTKETKKFLVNREDTLAILNDVALLSPGGIFGLSGTTGIGKTTILNLVEIDGIDKFFLEISERENKLMIIADILYKLSKICVKNHLVVSKAKKALEFVAEQVSNIFGYSAGLSTGIKSDFKKEKIHTSRLSVYKLMELMEDLIEKILNIKKKIIVVIDELDKEKKSDVLSVLDTIKWVFNRKGILTIVSLPPTIYKDYLKDSAKLSDFYEEGGNLDNVFKDIIMLHPMQTDHIVEMLIKRLKKHLDIFELDVFEEVALYSDGVPRDALRILGKAVIFYKNEEKITKDMMVNFIKKEATEKFSDFLNLTDNYIEVLKIASEKNEISRKELVEKLRKKNFKSQTSYVYIKRLLEKGYLIQTQSSHLRVSGKIRYLLC